MSTPSAQPFVARFPMRWVQLSRAGIAAIAAIMITFTADHSAEVGLSAFSGFAIATALILFLASWLTYPRERRWAPLTIGALSLVAGMIAGLIVWRSTALFFVVVITWAVTTGLVELIWGIRERRAAANRADLDRAESRDALTIGIITLLLAVGLAFVSPAFSLDYFIPEAGQSFTLTGVAIAVGIFGAYAAIVAVYIGIGAFSPPRVAEERTGLVQTETETP